MTSLQIHKPPRSKQKKKKNLPQESQQETVNESTEYF